MRRMRMHKPWQNNTRDNKKEQPWSARLIAYFSKTSGRRTSKMQWAPSWTSWWVKDYGAERGPGIQGGCTCTDGSEAVHVFGNTEKGTQQSVLVWVLYVGAVKFFTGGIGRQQPYPLAWDKDIRTLGRLQWLATRMPSPRAVGGNLCNISPCYLGCMTWYKE